MLMFISLLGPPFNRCEPLSYDQDNYAYSWREPRVMPVILLALYVVLTETVIVERVLLKLAYTYYFLSF